MASIIGQNKATCLGIEMRLPARASLLEREAKRWGKLGISVGGSSLSESRSAMALIIDKNEVPCLRIKMRLPVWMSR